MTSTPCTFQDLGSFQDQSNVSMAFSSKSERRNAVRFGNASRPSSSSSPHQSADDDFDAHGMGLGKKHLRETGRSCGKNSKHWRSWLDGLDLSPDVDVVGEIFVAETESDCD